MLGLKLSTGQLVKIVGQCGDALGVPYADLHATLAHQPAVNVDETGHRERVKRHWLWCAVAEGLTVFKIAAGRAASVLDALLGKDYRGVVCSDFFSAYRKFVAAGDRVAAYCWAHHFRG